MPENGSLAIENALNSAFEDQASYYEHIFSLYYPAHKRTGFTERNQTCAFVSKLLHCLGQKTEDKSLMPFVWYEAPLKRGHVDAVVFAPANEAVFFIEAKRLSKKKNKASLVADAKRLLNGDNRKFLLKNYQGNASNQYVVCLADVWFASSWKKEAPFWWTGKSQMAGFEDIYDPANLDSSFVSEVRNEGWAGENQLVHRFDGYGDDAWRRNYCLLMGYTKLAV